MPPHLSGKGRPGEPDHGHAIAMALHATAHTAARMMLVEAGALLRFRTQFGYSDRRQHLLIADKGARRLVRDV